MTNDELLQFFEKDTKMRKLDIFKPECFENHNGVRFTSTLCANVANAILQEYIEKNGVKVNGNNDQSDRGWAFDERLLPTTTHTATLINIEPIKKKCVEHENSPFHQDMFFGISQCRHCGVKLKAEWKEAE